MREEYVAVKLTRNEAWSIVAASMTGQCVKIALTGRAKAAAKRANQKIWDAAGEAEKRWCHRLGAKCQAVLDAERSQ